jgi:sugar phosphate isomerase/epimerase
MIYVSSSCVNATKIEKAIKILVEEGFTNIELSGGTHYDEDALNKLIQLKKDHNINFLLHNYFPTPANSFVLNLASLEPEISTFSLEHVKKAIDWSIALNAEKYAFHAGFLINIPLNQIGKKIEKVQLFDVKSAIGEFEKNLSSIVEYNNERVQLYIENNVLSQANYQSFDSVDPFFFTSSENLGEFKKPKSLNILLDAAHLKVSCNSLSLNFEKEFKKLYAQTDYFHISDNDGKSDSNQGLKEDSELFNVLARNWKSDKVVTIEVYSGMDDIKNTHRILEKLNDRND